MQTKVRVKSKNWNLGHFFEKLEEIGRSQSQLVLTNASVLHNGTYTCIARWGHLITDPTPILPRNHAGMAGADYVLLVESLPHNVFDGLGKQGFLLALLLTLLLFLAALVLALVFILR